MVIAPKPGDPAAYLTKSGVSVAPFLLSSTSVILQREVALAFPPASGSQSWFESAQTWATKVLAGQAWGTYPDRDSESMALRPFS